MDRADKEELIDLLADTFDEEILHLQLRLIREAQAPRFEALGKKNKQIMGDFVDARNHHTNLLEIRRRRMKKLTELIEGE